MASKQKMDRAKQFCSFDPFKGFREALAAKEKQTVSRSELSEEMREELDYKFRQIKLKDMITIIYFHQGEYLKKTGLVSKIDLNSHYIQIIQTKIYFEDIYDICIEEVLS